MEIELKDFLTYLASEKGLSLNTRSAYKHDIESFAAFLKEIHCPHFSEVTEEIILRFLSTLKEKGFAGSSINRTLIAIKVFFRFLKREGLIPKNPTLYLTSPKLWQLIPEVLTGDEIERLLASPDLSTENGCRDRAILELLYSSGLRVSELCQLKLYDIDDQFVRVMGKGSKERLVPIGKKALQAVDEYLNRFRDRQESNRQTSLFVNSKGKPLSRMRIWNLIKTYGKNAGISKNISPHTMRHSFATHLLDNGADLRVIQEMLGHATISSTDRYTHISAAKLVSAFQSFHPRK